MRYRAYLVAGASLFLLTLVHWPALAADVRMVLSTGMREPWTDDRQSGVTNHIMDELFRRLGVHGQIVFNPAAARALALANDGTDDGLAARIAGLEDKYPNLVRVPEPIFVNDFVAATDPAAAFAIRSWKDLSTHSVAYILGWQIFDRNVGKTQNLTQVKDSAQLLSLIRTSRTEVVLHERWQVLWHARQMGIALRIQEPPLQSVPMYIYLHRKNMAWVKPFDATLKAMKADGSYQAILSRSLDHLDTHRQAH